MWLRFAGRSVLDGGCGGADGGRVGGLRDRRRPPRSRWLDVEVRDRLIADQEALLNTYRCMFGVDTQVVPGGCSNGAPALPAEDPAPFPGNPTAKDIEIRDKLVADQEALLNVYRCRFNIDTRIVPGGCSDQEVAIPDPTSEEGVEGWIVVPWDEDFLEALLKSIAAVQGLPGSGNLRSWDPNQSRQCDSPEDTEVLYQLLANHHRSSAPN